MGKISPSSTFSYQHLSTPPRYQNTTMPPEKSGFLSSVKRALVRRNSGDNKQVSRRTSMPDSTPAAPSGPPPSYNDATAHSAVSTTSDEDDRYSFLRKFDTVFVIDDSGSMVGRSWRETEEALAAIAPICTLYDDDGVDVHFINSSNVYRGVTSPAAVREIFSTVRPRGSTPTGQRLSSILRPYIAKYSKSPDSVKPLNIIVITDGEPTDDLEASIIDAAKKLDKLDAPSHQVGIQFFQVGSSRSASEHLKQLDDELANIAGVDEIRDMVDTVPWTHENHGSLNAEGILKVVLGAVMRRLDRRKSPSLYDRTH